MTRESMKGNRRNPPHGPQGNPSQVSFSHGIQFSLGLCNHVHCVDVFVGNEKASKTARTQHLSKIIVT